MKRKDVITLAIAGGAGVAIYMVVKHQQRAALAASMAPVPVEPPSILDVILGKIPEAVQDVMDKTKETEALIAKRGPAHLKAWKDALAKGRQFYVIQAGGVTHCFKIDGSKATRSECDTPDMLEGLWRT